MDVLGRVIEVLDGRPFARFMKEELFHPLELKDTGFSLPEEKWERVAKIYDPRDEQISEFMCCPEYTDDEIERIGRKRFPIRSYKQNTNIIAMGGADIFSTAYDYARFLQMLVNKGSLNGKRILGRRTVAMINRPLEHLFMPEDTNIAMGLGVGVVKDENSSYEPHSSGSYWWGGYFFTSFWVDPEEGLIGVIMNQVNPTTSKLVDRFHQLVYSALGE
jgi:CubicO group peptidase (beta-lactamase class C family)